MKLRRTAPVLLGLSLLMTLCGGWAAQAGPSCAFCMPVVVDYTIDNLQYDVDDIVVFGMTSASPTNDPTLSQLGLFSAPQGTSTISVNYGESVPISSTFMIGVTTEIAGETTGAVVLFTNNAFATANTGNDFNTIFFDLLNYSEWYTDQLTPGSIAGESMPSNGEATLIADLQSWTQDEVDLYHFAAGDTMFPFMPAGAISSISFAPGASFTAIAFSGGQIIGTGTSAASPTPEPAIWALLLLGLGGLGAALRSRRRVDRGVVRFAVARRRLRALGSWPS